MKKGILNVLKIVLPLALGAFLIYHFYGKIDAADKDKMIEAFARADYKWVWISIVLAIFSHMSRAYRWKYTVKPLGYNLGFLNSFFAVMIGYLVNLAVPRLGEVSRCVTVSRVEKIPLEKLIGTVIAERIADLIMLLTFIASVTIIQYDFLSGFLEDIYTSIVDKILGLVPDFIPGYFFAILLGIAAIVGIYMAVRLFKSSSDNKVIVGLKNILKGVTDGVLSIVKMEDKWYFIFHTLFIWAMYVGMFWFSIYALPETSTLSPGAIISGFVLGGIAMVVTNGGIGAYPIAIQTVFALYAIEETIGGTIGWIMWTAQTILVIVLGGLSFALIPVFNRNKETQEAEVNVESNVNR